MALRIRLSRGGAKKRPYYRIVVADSRSPRDGRFIERIGSYNPLLPKDSGERVKIDAEKAHDWIVKGAQPSDRVGRFLSLIRVEREADGSIKRDEDGKFVRAEGDAGAPLYEWKHGDNPKKGAPGEKAKQRIADREEKEAAKAEAAAAPAEAPAEEEAPAEAEAPAEEEAKE